MDINNQSLQGDTINIAPKEDFILRRGSVLKDCQITNKATAWYLRLTRSVIEGGSFSTKVRLNELNWLRVKLHGVTFKGKFVGNDFGTKAEIYENLGEIRDCDFTEASVHLCRFFNCDIASNKFAPNHFILPRNASSSRSLLSLNWPDSIHYLAEMYARHIEELSFSVADISLLAKEEKTTEDEIRQLFGRVEGIVMT